MLRVPHAAPDRKRHVKTKTGQDGRTWGLKVIVGWTGHRPDLFDDVDSAMRAVSDAAHELVSGGRVERFLVGGQRGVDTWAAQAAIDNHLPFTLILPLSVPEF